jgi:hypothetical protein
MRYTFLTNQIHCLFVGPCLAQISVTATRVWVSVMAASRCRSRPGAEDGSQPLVRSMTLAPALPLMFGSARTSEGPGVAGAGA